MAASEMVAEQSTRQYTESPLSPTRPLVSPPDEDIVQRVPVSQPRVHSGGFLSRRKADGFVGLQGWSSGRGVDADNGGEFASPERQVEAHQAIVDALQQTGQASHDVVPDGRGGASVPSLCLGTTAPEEGLASTNLLHLALFEEAGLADCNDVHLEARLFPGH
nr:unnamed protein product [Spirometra erinaceieuropaei]